MSTVLCYSEPSVRRSTPAVSMLYAGVSCCYETMVSYCFSFSIITIFRLLILKSPSSINISIRTIFRLFVPKSPNSDKSPKECFSRGRCPGPGHLPRERNQDDLPAFNSKLIELSSHLNQDDLPAFVSKVMELSSPLNQDDLPALSTKVTEL